MIVMPAGNGVTAVVRGVIIELGDPLVSSHQCNSQPKRTYHNHEHDNPCIRPRRDGREFYLHSVVYCFLCTFICLCFLRLLFICVFVHFNFFLLFNSCVSTARKRVKLSGQVANAYITETSVVGGTQSDHPPAPKLRIESESAPRGCLMVRAPRPYSLCM